MTTYDDRRLWPGTVPPVAGAPVRRAGSVRRTTNVDLVRPDGFGGPLVISGRGRDLATGVDGEARTVEQGWAEVVVDYAGGRLVSGVRADPWPDGLDGVIGARAGSGFRRALAEAVPGLAASGSIVHQLLDEVSPGTLISGSALAREGLIHLAAGPAAGGRTPQIPTDICAGWQAGGAMHDAIAETGVPLLGWGPPAPSLTVADDALAWHSMGDLSPMSMRRRRLVDLGAGGEVEVRYRDSYWEHDGTETVVHEYGLWALVDVETWVVLEASAVPGPLPAPECPSAAASAGRLVGQRVGGLREVVRDTFTGTTTCTHLNDVFRSLADLPHIGDRGLGRVDRP